MHHQTCPDRRIHRYVITDYDNKNFTVAQATFNENSEPKVVPIPWNATVAPAASNRLGRNATTGISIGSVAFVLLISIAIIYFILRRLKERAGAASKDAAMPALGSSETRPFSAISIQEIGPQSVQELHATSHPIELLDTSRSGIEIKELPGWKKVSPPALLSTAIKDYSTPAQRKREVFSTNIKEKPSRSSITWNSNISIPSLNTGPHRATHMEKDTMESGMITIRSGKNISKVSARNNVTKALPPPPLEECQSGQNHSLFRSHLTTPISESIQMLPVSHVIARALPAPEVDSVAVDSRMSPTYATIFNVEAYQDSAIDSPALSSTQSVNINHLKSSHRRY